MIWLCLEMGQAKKNREGGDGEFHTVARLCKFHGRIQNVGLIISIVKLGVPNNVFYLWVIQLFGLFIFQSSYVQYQPKYIS